MRRWIVAVVALCVAPIAGAQGDCDAALAGTPRRVSDARYVVAYVVSPDPIAVGAHFVIDFAVCPRDGAPPPDAMRIDATMPEHRHGMNYHPTVTARAPGYWHAEGMLFHMPGRWDLAFDVVTGTRSERITSTLRVE